MTSQTSRKNRPLEPAQQQGGPERRLGEPTHQEARPFEREAPEVVARLRDALAKVIAAIPRQAASEHFDRPTDLQRALDIRSTLAWRIFRFAQAQNPLAEAIELPGLKAMSRFFTAARRKGAPPELISEARQAMLQYEAMVERHAESRTAFNSMLADLAGDGGQAVDLAHRRSAFAASGHIWGMQARARFTTMLYHPSNNAEMDAEMDVASIRGVLDLRQFRPNRPYLLSRSHVEHRPGSRYEHPIDPETHEKYGVSLLGEFCNPRSPQINTYIEAGGDLVAELIPGGIGRTGLVSAVVAACYRHCDKRYSTPEIPLMGTFYRFDTPVATYVADVLIADGAYGPRLPELKARMVGKYLSGGDSPDNLREQDDLWKENVAYLGRGRRAMALPDVPRYGEIIDSVAGKLSWDADCFHVFRCRIEFPVMLTTLMLTYDIPLSKEELVHAVKQRSGGG